MPAFVGPITLAPVGTTGNNTHTGVSLGAQSEEILFLFNLEVAGATPTVTYKLQGSMDNTNWYDIFSIPSDSDTGAITFTKTAVGVFAQFPSNQSTRFSSYVRLVSSANTNVTYSATLWSADQD